MPLERCISPPESFKFHCDSININNRRKHRSRRNEFKFHCDSINIKMEELEKFYSELFKFHCDSINIQRGL